MSKPNRPSKILPRDKIGTLRNVDGVLNIEKLKEKMNAKGLEFLGFFNEVEALTGHPLSFVAGKWYEFLLMGNDMIEIAAIQFNMENGMYNGVRDIYVPQRRPKGSKIIIGQREYKELRTEEVNRMLERFETKAKELGYLL